MAEIGEMGWLDLTVDNADAVRDFYAAVVGWKPEPVDMGGYWDYNMVCPQTGAARAGICHRRNTNAYLPPQWIPYFTVADLDAKATAVEQAGGRLLSKVRGSAAQGRYLFVEDPAGAVSALFEKAAE